MPAPPVEDVDGVAAVVEAVVEDVDEDSVVGEHPDRITNPAAVALSARNGYQRMLSIYSLAFGSTLAGPLFAAKAASLGGRLTNRVASRGPSAVRIDAPVPCGVWPGKLCAISQRSARKRLSLGRPSARARSYANRGA